MSKQKKYFIEGKLFSEERMLQSITVNHSNAMTKQGSRWVRYIYDTKEDWDKAWDQMIEAGDGVFKPINCGEVE